MEVEHPVSNEVNREAKKQNMEVVENPKSEEVNLEAKKQKTKEEDPKLCESIATFGSVEFVRDVGQWLGPEKAKELEEKWGELKAMKAKVLAMKANGCLGFRLNRVGVDDDDSSRSSSAFKVRTSSESRTSDVGNMQKKRLPSGFMIRGPAFRMKQQQRKKKTEEDCRIYFFRLPQF